MFSNFKYHSQLKQGNPEMVQRNVYVSVLFSCFYGDIKNSAQSRLIHLVFLYPLKDCNINLLASLLYKTNILYNYTIRLERYPEEQNTMTTQRPVEHRD